ncbi:hypothetical protein CsSME_00031260 [Camellia sinensis var. sinensis]
MIDQFINFVIRPPRIESLGVPMNFVMGKMGLLKKWHVYVIFTVFYPIIKEEVLVQSWMVGVGLCLCCAV